MQNSRRKFLKNLSATAVVAPLILHSCGWPNSPKSNIVNLGLIGMGTQMRGLMRNFMGRPDIRIVAVCDVDYTRREHYKKIANDFYKNDECKAYPDFRDLINRKDIDAVVIATPDHWHAIPMLAALRAGKDVYCEKPLTHNIHEAVEVMKAVEVNNRILQTGSMQRSSNEFRVACELVQNGVIGQISHVECSFGAPGIPCDLPEEQIEPGLDWKMWCGPGPLRPYNSVLSPRGVHDTFPNWRLYKEYGSGGVGDWGAHHLDIAQWGLGMDNSGPVEVIPPEDEKATSGCKFVYSNGITLEHKNNGFGVHFFGSKGEVKVNRGQFVLIIEGKTIAEFTDIQKKEGKIKCADEVNKAEQAYLQNAKIQLYKSKSHTNDFMECLKSRKKPITSEIVGAHSAICCHLMNQSYYHHARFTWDPAKYEITGGTGDPKWLTREYSSPWMV